MSGRSMFALIVVLVLCTGGAVAAPQPLMIQLPFGQGIAEPDTRGYLGVNIREVDAELVERLDLSEERGVYVGDVQPDGPAAESGFEPEDVVVTWNGTRVEGILQFQRLVAETPPGREVQAEVSRQGGLEKLQVVVGKREGTASFGGGGVNPNLDPRGMIPGWPGLGRSRQGGPDVDTPAADTAPRPPKLGIELLPLSEQLADYFGAEPGSGALIASVKEESPAAEAGLKAGDILLEIDDEPVNAPAEVIRAIARKDGLVDLKILRDRDEMSIAAEIGALDQEDEDEEPPTYPRNAM